MWIWVVDSVEWNGIRCDKALQQAITEDLGDWDGEPAPLSRSQIQNLVKSGSVLINGETTEVKSKLRVGDQIELTVGIPDPYQVLPEDLKVPILFEDQDIVVIDKPAGMITHPTSKQSTGTLVNALLFQIKDLSGIGGVSRPGIVHRLDKNTSGVMVVTKNDVAHNSLSKQFSVHSITRKYWALCYGSPRDLSGKIDAPITRNPTDRKRMHIDKSGKRAVTHYKLEESYGSFASLITAKLETGRTHQVRVHLTSIQHSLLGDPEYGMPTQNQKKWVALPTEVQSAVAKLPGQALHARHLSFDHPRSGERVEFTSNPPESFQNCLNLLRKWRE